MPEYNINITVTVDDEGTHMSIDSDLNSDDTITALRRMIELLEVQSQPSSQLLS